MNDQSPKELNPIVIMAIIAQVFFTIFAIISIVNMLNSKTIVPSVRVDDYSEINDKKTAMKGSIAELNDTRKSVVEGILYEIISMNTPDSVKNYGAKIREESVTNIYLDEFDANFLNFIVDVEELGQSYNIVYRWSDKYPNKIVPSDNPAMAFCPREEDLIYGDFDCRDKYGNRADQQIVYEMLQEKDFDGFAVYVDGDVYHDGELMIDIRTPSNDNEVVEEAINSVSNYLSSLGFELQDYNYTAGYVRTQ